MNNVGKVVAISALTTFLAIGSALAQASSGQTGGGDAKQQDAPSSSQGK
ncbi:MAG: hypothetical protein JOZ16_02285 [Methylobacteriaceae bacterium]|nr:hypothetical protein [Methylobacteriaceae bacterium]